MLAADPRCVKTSQYNGAKLNVDDTSLISISQDNEIEYSTLLYFKLIIHSGINIESIDDNSSIFKFQDKIALIPFVLIVYIF